MIIGSLGIPLLSLDVGVSKIQGYILSFLAMNFNFLGNPDNLTILIVGWSVSLVLFGVFVKPDWKIPIYTMLSELVVYAFTVILLKRHSPILFQSTKIELLEGFGILCALFCLLYIPIGVRFFLKKRAQEKKKENIIPKYISKCPHCGKEYQSNPTFCITCSKQISSS